MAVYPRTAEGSLVTALPSLTRTQQAVLDAITTHVQAHGYPPTLRELATATGVVSTSTVVFHLKALQHLGYIRRAPGASRAIQVIEQEAEAS